MSSHVNVALGALRAAAPCTSSSLSLYSDAVTSSTAKSSVPLLNYNHLVQNLEALLTNLVQFPPQKTLATWRHDYTTLQTQMKLKSNISCEETKKLLICKSDVMKAPDLSYVTRASAFILVYIWFVRQRHKAARVVREGKKMTHISRSEKKKKNRISNCRPHHVTGSFILNKNNVARLHLLPYFSTGSRVSVSVQYASTTRHSTLTG
jgi:hypothetical protein